MKFYDVRIDSHFKSKSLGISRRIYRSLIDDLLDLLFNKVGSWSLLCIEDLIFRYTTFNTRFYPYELKYLSKNSNMVIDDLFKTYLCLEEIVKKDNFHYRVLEENGYCYIRMIKP